MSAFLPILSRWTHLVTACIAVGGVFFLRIVLPIGLRAVDGPAGHAVMLKCRRVFKMTTHTAILLLLLTGFYNFWQNMDAYKLAGAPLAHGLFVMHALLGLIVFGLLLWLLAGAEPPAGHMRWLAVTLGLMLIAVAFASVLKTVRESGLRKPVPAATH
jgi:uncharacterized membrane protein